MGLPKNRAMVGERQIQAELLEDDQKATSRLHLRRPFPKQVYEVRPRKDRRGFDLISDVLPFGRLWYGGPNAAINAIGYATQYSRSHDAVIRVYDESGDVIETHEHKGDFKEP